jgi:general stress protein YciG
MAQSDRGFASMDPAKQKMIASKGGKATAGKNLTTAARAKGGRTSRRGSARS